MTIEVRALYTFSQSKRFPFMAAIVSRVIMWLIWVLAALLAALMPFMSKAVERTVSPSAVFTFGVFLFPTLVCGALRIWAMHVENRWLILVPYLLGVFFAFQTGFYGVFLLPGHFLLFQLLAASLLLAFLPAFFHVSSSKSDR